MNKKEKTSKSKFLSLVLRHKPETIGINLDENGWVDVNVLLSAMNGRISENELNEIVSTCEKQRYAFSEDGKRIRANQGHSVKVDLALKEEIPPQCLYHGTGECYIGVIRKEGIKKMNRHHVHLSDNKDTARKVGSRHGVPVIITVLARNMYNDGIKFYKSENGVWLTDYINPKYFL
jgi:putative RNA 2'-phosphotransferase